MTLRPPRQARSRRTLDRLTQTAMSLMAERGVERTSIAQIVQEAGSSVGSFYARFEGKDDFIQFLEARVWSDARERWDDALARIADRTVSTQDLVAGVVRLLVETGQADLDRRRVLGSASGSREQAQAFHSHVQSGITTLLADRRAEFHHPAPDRAIALGYGVISSSVDGLEDLRRGTATGDNEELVTELTRLYLAYLGSSSAPPTARLQDNASAGVLAPALSVSPQGSDPNGPTSEPDPTTSEPDREPDAVDFFDVWG